MVLLDNYICHKSPTIIKMILGKGALVRFLEPYDPVHQPIEIGFRSMKQWMKINRKAIRSFPVPSQIRIASRLISNADSRHAYHHAGYF